MPTGSDIRRYEPDRDEFGEMQRAYLRRALLFGAPALVVLLFAFVTFLVWVLTSAPGWVFFLLALPAALGAMFQLVLLWLERPGQTQDAVAVEVGQGLLRFVNDETGTVEEVRWKESRGVSVQRRSDAVEIVFPSGRRSRVHWFAYSEREQLLKDLMALKETPALESRPEDTKAPPRPAETAQTKPEDSTAKSGKSAKTSTKARKRPDEEE